MDQKAELTRESLLEALRGVSLPDSSHDIVSGGLVTGLVIKGANVGFALDIGDSGLTPETAESVRKAAEEAIKAVPGVLSVSIVVTAERGAPPPERGPAPPNLGPHAPEPSAPLVPGAKAIIAVASGKGGVGKSTVAVNLALALHREGMRIGLLDADIYGPSVPKMLGAEGRPESDGQRVQPMAISGLKVMSMGFLLDVDTPTIWRGPMVAGAVQQMLGDVEWGDLDVLVVDMPPGTGDAQLTLAQRVPLAGAVIVSTPQDIALIDARKAIAMFRKVNVPVLGIVENMSQFTCPHCGETSHIFGEGGARTTARQMAIPFLGEIPLDARIREMSDAGTPVAGRDSDKKLSGPYLEIGRKVAKALALTAIDRAPDPSGP